MTQVGAFEAKTHLANLLERVEQGERILITRRGKPVAMLVPPEEPAAADVPTTIREMLATRDREGPKLGRGLTVRQLVEEGRRF